MLLAVIVFRPQPFYLCTLQHNGLQFSSTAKPEVLAMEQKKKADAEAAEEAGDAPAGGYSSEASDEAEGALGSDTNEALQALRDKLAGSDS